MNFKKNFLKYLLINVIIFYVTLANSFATDPQIFVQTTVDEASKALSNNSTKEEKIIELKSIAKRTVDIKGIAYYSLGSHRKTLSAEEKKNYLAIFEKYFLKSFSSRLAEYTDPKIRVESKKILNEKYTMVSSTLIATEDKPEIKIDWRVKTKIPENPLIIDVIIEGVSLAKVQREEFSSVIESNGGDINALFSSLTNFINK